MERLLWMLPWLPLVLSAVGELPKPVNVTLVSEGFSHLVKWEPGAGTPAQAYYQVSITTERWVSCDVVSGCERVQHQLLCNLTEAWSDPTQTYIILVRAALDQQASQPAYAPRFKPLDHMDQPLLTVTHCRRDLCVDLQPPVERYRDVYDRLHYHLQIKSREWDEPPIKTQGLRGQTLKNLLPGRLYCVSVSFWEILEETKSNFSKPVCEFSAISTPEGFWILASLVLLMVFVGIVASLLIFTGFICLRDTTLPSVLASIRHTEERLAAACSPSLASLWSVKPCDADKASRSSSSDLSDQEGGTEDVAQSAGSAYELKAGTASLRSSSSSSSCQPEPKHGDFSVRVPEPVVSAPRSQRGADEEEDEEGEEGDGQEVNLLSLRLGRFEEMEDRENLLSAEDESPAPLSPAWFPEDGASEPASGCSEEEPDDDSGYTRRPRINVQRKFK
uniref:Interferon alpha/beta receptor 2-like n=1 Tax=Salarias fasciatus TaxID=181472 RepID=A0A672HVW6_SALFA